MGSQVRTAYTNTGRCYTNKDQINCNCHIHESYIEYELHGFC